MIFGAYSNELHEIILLKSWDIWGLLWADLLLKDLKRQLVQFSLSNLIRFYLELDWICEQDYEKQHDCQWGFEGKFFAIPEGSAFKFSYEY